MKTHNTEKAPQYLIMVMCCLVYSIAYLGRYSYNANITLIIDDYGTTKAQAGLVSTCFFFAYGVGQVINGIMSSRYNKKWLFTIALILSSVINLSVFFKVPFFAIKYLWFLNGLIQSCLWSGIISVVSRTIDEKHMNSAMIILSTTACLGTILAYGASSLFAYIGNFRTMFLFSAIVMAALGLIWFLIYSPKYEIYENKSEPEKKAERSGFDRAFLGIILMMCVFAVIHNLIKDGLTTWAPDILKQRYGLGDSFSILLTIALPILGVFGSLISVRAVNRISNFITVISLFFAVGAVSIGAISMIPQMNMIIAVIFFGIVECVMHGVNNTVTSLAPLKMRGKADSGKMAGIFNGCCYLGSTLSAYGLGKLADIGGWHMVLNILFAVCTVSVFAGIGFNIIKRQA